MNIIGLNQKEIAGISGGGSKDDQSNSYTGYIVAAAAVAATALTGAYFFFYGKRSNTAVAALSNSMLGLARSQLRHTETVPTRTYTKVPFGATPTPFAQ